MTAVDRDTFRRSQLCAWLILLMFVGMALLLPGALEDRPTLLAVSIALLATLVALFLNRAGLVTTAGVTLVVALTFCIALGVYEAPGHQLTNDYLPSLFLYILPAVLAAALLPVVWATTIQVGLTGLLTAHILLQPLGADVQAGAAQYGLLGVIDRQLFLLVILAGISDLILLIMRRSDERADFAVDTAKVQLEFNAWLDWYLSLIEDRIGLFVQSPTAEVRLSDMLKSGEGAPGVIPEGMVGNAVKFDIQLRRIRDRIAAADESARAYHSVLNALTILDRNLETVRQGYPSPQSLGQLRIGVPPFDNVATKFDQILQILQHQPPNAPRTPGTSDGAPGYPPSSYPTQPGIRPANPYTPPADPSPSPPPANNPSWRGNPPSSSSPQTGQGTGQGTPFPENKDWRF